MRLGYTGHTDAERNGWETVSITVFVDHAVESFFFSLNAGTVLAGGERLITGTEPVTTNATAIAGAPVRVLGDAADTVAAHLLRADESCAMEKKEYEKQWREEKEAMVVHGFHGFRWGNEVVGLGVRRGQRDSKAGTGF